MTFNLHFDNAFYTSNSWLLFSHLFLYHSVVNLMVLQRSHNGYDEDCTKGLSSSLWWWDSQRRWAEDRRSKQTQRVPCLHVSFSFSLAEGKKRNRAFVGKLCASNIKHWCKCLMFNLLLQLLLALLQEIGVHYHHSLILSKIQVHEFIFELFMQVQYVHMRFAVKRM